ncbi:M24 family metallopeptidase [Chloroflexota bacterium]
MPLSTDEQGRRYRVITSMMEEKELSILLVASNAMLTGHARYFSNYPPHFGNAFVVFPKEGTPTQFVFSKIQEQVAGKRWIKDSRQSSNYAADIVKRIKELDYKGKNIGLVGVDNISFIIFDHLRKELPEVTFIDATGEINKLRMIKSLEEQALVRECTQITDQLYSRVKEVTKVGVSEFEIYAEMEYFLRKKEIESAFNLIGSGLFPVAPFISPSRRVLGPEDSLIVELTPRYEGYYTQLTVLAHPEEPSQRMKEFIEIALSAQKAALKLVKPGNRASDVAQAMKDFVEKAGYSCPYRGGHGMGHDFDEPPGIIVGDDTLLRPGMAIVIHPSVIDKNGEGVFLGDSYLVTDTGWERLNTGLNK